MPSFLPFVARYLQLWIFISLILSLKYFSRFAAYWVMFSWRKHRSEFTIRWLWKFFTLSLQFHFYTHFNEALQMKRVETNTNIHLAAQHGGRNICKQNKGGKPSACKKGFLSFCWGWGGKCSAFFCFKQKIIRSHFDAIWKMLTLQGLLMCTRDTSEDDVTATLVLFRFSAKRNTSIGPCIKNSFQPFYILFGCLTAWRREGMSELLRNARQKW